MRTANRNRLVAALGVVALVVGGASLALACTRIPSVSVTPSFGRAGSQTTVVGRAFSTGEPVQIRWNSTGGPVIGEALGPNFSVAVTIPEAPAGVYYIVATAPTSRAQNAFRVTSAANNASEPAPSGDGQTSADSSGADGTQSNGGATSTSANGGTGTSTASPEQSGTLGFAEPSSNADTTAQPTTNAQPATESTSAPVATAAKAPATSASANPAVITTPAGRPVFGGSATTPAPVTATGAPADEQAQVTARSASGDLWSGFGPSGRASMVPSLVDPATSQGPGSELAVGLALLGGGVVALMSGVGVAEMRRKRALAGSASR